MRVPIYVRPLTDAEREQVEAGLRSPEAFVLRRCQIVLASARGEQAPAIALRLGCGDQTVRNALHAFDAAGAERLRALLHRSPRTFGKPTGLWTLALAAAVSFEQGLTAGPVSGETIRVTLKRLGVGWKRAKRWLTSPDPAYARKKGLATG